MDVFFDTEFSEIDPHAAPARLISIGCVAQDGREFYAELNDSSDTAGCSEFVVDTVLPLLEGGAYLMTEAELAVRLREWIEGLTDEMVIFRSDSVRHDWHWVVELFQNHGEFPKNLRPKCGEMYFNHDDQARKFQDGFAKYWVTNYKRMHHALVDARSLHFAWEAAIR